MSFNADSSFLWENLKVGYSGSWQTDCRATLLKPLTPNSEVFFSLSAATWCKSGFFFWVINGGAVWCQNCWAKLVGWENTLRSGEEQRPSLEGNSGTQVILIVLFVATKGFFNLSSTTNTAQSSSVLHDATEKYYWEARNVNPGGPIIPQQFLLYSCFSWTQGSSLLKGLLLP